MVTQLGMEEETALKGFLHRIWCLIEPFLHWTTSFIKNPLNFELLTYCHFYFIFKSPTNYMKNYTQYIIHK